MELGTPPQRLAPILVLRAPSQPELAGQLVLGTFGESISGNPREDQRFFNPNKSSTYTKGDDVSFTAQDGAVSGRNETQPAVTGSRGSDMMALNGLTVKQEFGTCPR
jgi:hypothetical protein